MLNTKQKLFILY